MYVLRSLSYSLPLLDIFNSKLFVSSKEKQKSGRFLEFLTFGSKCRNLLSFLPSRGSEGMVNEIRRI